VFRRREKKGKAKEGRKERDLQSQQTGKKGAKAWVYWQRHFGPCAYVLSE
jgi:hypothetical protein